MRIKHLVRETYKITTPYTGINSVEDCLVRNSFLVVKDGDDFAGILVPEDIIESPHQLVTDCLHEKPHIDDRTEVESVFDLMMKKHHSVLPVFGDNRFTGVVTLEDITNYYIFEYRKELEQKVSLRTAELRKEIEQRRQTEDELRKARETAEAASNAKTLFLSKTSHELRTPLNAILGYCQILRLDESLSESQLRAVEIIHRSGEHLLMMINDILEISRIEKGITELQPVNIHFDFFFKTVLEIINIRLQKKEILLNFEIVSDLPETVRADEKRLRQILINLLDNAIKYTEKGGIVLKVGRHGSKIRFSVEDTGIGIAPEKRKEIFIPFRQLNDGGYQDGLGLGLPITVELIRLMGGELHVESRPGGGSIFFFELDLPPGDDNSDNIIGDYVNDIMAYIPYQRESGKAYQILIADDVEHNISVLKEMISSLGFEITEADNGEDAVKIATEIKPDLILMDLIMPRMNGFEAAKRIRQNPELCGVPVLAVSADIRDETKQLGAECGFHDFIKKPVNQKELLKKIKSCLKPDRIFRDKCEPAQEEDRGVFLPPEEDLNRIRTLLRKGDIKTIRIHAEKLKSPDSEFRVFGEKLYRYARNVMLDEIKKLIG